MILKNKISVITGGATGIGKATVETFALQGATVIFCDVNKVEGENFDAFIVLKKTKKGAVPTWIKTGKTDLNYVEVKEGINFDETVYVLPSEGLIKYQQKFSERIKGRFG